MDPQPVVTVIIPCYNAERWLEQTLASIAAQEGVELEVVLVDDGSTDRSVELARQVMPSIRVAHTLRAGPSGARNAGTELARGAFLQYLDADDLLAPGKLAAQLRLLEETGADVAYGDWQRLVEGADGVFRPADVVSGRLDGAADVTIFSRFWCPTGTYLFRRSLVERVGKWNERLPIVQDARFVLDCALHGGRFVACPGVMALYRVHSSGSVSTQDRAAFLRDCLRNAEEVEAWWEAHGGTGGERHTALLNAYGYIARSSYGSDPATFESAYGALQRLEPGYLPSGQRSFGWIARIAGYRRAERVALALRSARTRIRRALDGAGRG